jgi:preprotein translocase subunit SecB
LINNVQTLDRSTYELAKSLIACANLRSIRFVKFAVQVDLPQGAAAEEVELSTSGRSSGTAHEGGMNLTFDLKVQGKKDENTIISIAGRLLAEYDLPDEEHPSPEQMKAFAKTNGMVNIWPYWREFVQASTLRAGLPPLTMPLFRVVRQAQR